VSALFSPLTLRGTTFRNRIFVSPMCMYSSRDGFPTNWHLVHLGSRAVGGAALVMQEATAVAPDGRISPDDAGIWSETHGTSYARITSFIREHGALPGIQLAHAGRKASTDLPWLGGNPLSEGKRGWRPVGPSAVAFDEVYAVPHELTADEIGGIVRRFADAARWAVLGGYEVVEIHMAHGYLLHEFLSPLSNRRSDAWGGGLENRMRLPLAVATAVRDVWPSSKPVFARISATDWVDGGWDLDQSVELARRLGRSGVDLVDVSSGGVVPHAKIPTGPGYQVPFAEAIRSRAGIPTGAVGFITEPRQAEEIVASEKADAVLLAREMLRDPYWPLHAAKVLGTEGPWPVQYRRA
jgi:2,4-dienoyl-CoA reductase-like NADH-dependent reductase (Old Yellow Enzyme family)